jgi:hypothetical protein
MGVMQGRAGRLAKAMVEAQYESNSLLEMFEELLAHHEASEALLSEAAQVEGPLSADLRERMADAVGV